jgi:hypothetical protein
LRGGDVWLAIETVEASGELRELLGSWTAILLIFPLFLFCSFSFSLSLLLSRGIVEILRSLIFLQRVSFLFKNMCFVAKLVCR